jgi:hypothetical protein
MFAKLKPYKWLLAGLLVLLVWMAYADLNGWRLFTWGSDSNWNANGPGYHK